MVSQRKPNRLINQSSPYLLQHAHDPVDWYPWCREAFDRARREGKPVFLSIGYAACHWCHVMQRESFMDERVADLLNRHFIAVKVDREERPDIDTIYMNAVQLMTGSGGWPLSVFLTPDGKPFFGGTYFPPEDRSGTPGFARVLEEIAQFFSRRGDDARRAAEQLAGQLRQACDIHPRGRDDSEISRNVLAVAFRNLAALFDGEHGGFGHAPKFPHPTALAFLLRYHAATGEPHALNMVELTLERMARGGIYDHLGGGFHRYSTDPRWLVPHFEKMLNDNALLAAVYLDAYLIAGKAAYQRIARDTLDYMLREMSNGRGAFCSSQDSDSRGREGAYYLWTAEEIRAVVGNDLAETLLRHLGVEPVGNFKGAESVLSIAATADELAEQLGRPASEIEKAIAEGRRAMFEIRAERLPPAIDDKVLTEWNALAISALSRAGASLGETRYIEAARRCAQFLLRHSRHGDGRLSRAWHHGKTGPDACLADYATLASALIDLYGACLEVRWLEEAAALASTMIERFWDENEGGFFYTVADQMPDGLVRPKDSFDNPNPSGNAAAVAALLRLAELTEREDWREKAMTTLRLFLPTVVRSPCATGHMLSALEFCTAPPALVIVVGEPGDALTDALIGAQRSTFVPNALLVHANPAERDGLARIERIVPAVRGKVGFRDKPTAYVCRGRTCGPPTSDPDDLLCQLLPPHQ